MNSDIPAPLLDFSYRADLDILVSRWAYQPDPHELPAAYRQMCEAAVRDQARFWLQDIRRRTLNDPGTTNWLLNKFFPEMANRLGGRLYIAYLVGPALHESIVSHPGYVSAEAYDDKPFATSFFNDEGAAIRWLQIQQTDKVRT
ncbi:hypothetical protein [Hymenobacter properus]|uniref:STAS/SEC14 domain-containing protein n=1 Tax=Hymenobacter properus TaxID=2791026 RepID=A0A931FK50_9BACT|nr:hypothetical protein [Hymenobacter properus]MBF9142648.1 hypothetical protein [Hymenobacter properus]MBR7721456.1 hypothetical protein [Microvirga sp. SRT04]